MFDVDVYEIKLGDEFLMSSQFTAAEIELARLGLAAFGRGHARLAESLVWPGRLYGGGPAKLRTPPPRTPAPSRWTPHTSDGAARP